MRTILIIDDDPTIRELLAAYLTQEGYDALTAADGRSGLSAFTQEAPDAVLCDLAMPGLGGLEVLAEVRSRSPQTPFLVISGTGDMATVIEALRLGAWDFLIKPLPDLNLLKPILTRIEERVRFLQEKELYQKRLEEQIQARTAQLTRQLNEKDLLLAEVHHRVKNNLQIILVLLDLEREHEVSPEVRDALGAVRSRVHTLALVQEEMHDADHATLVRARNYGTGLVHHLLSAHGLTAYLELTLELEDLALRPGMAFHWGLVLNELFGALELSGPLQEPWSLTVTLRSAGAGSLELTLAESRGIWEAWAGPEASPSAGWALVSALVAQGGGSVTRDPDRAGVLKVILKD